MYFFTLNKNISILIKPVQTLPNYILSKKIEEGAFSPMFDGEMIYNGEIFPFSFKNICEKNVLLFFCPFIFDPKVLDLLQMIEEYFKFKEKCSDSNKKITDNLALAIISIDSLQAILEFYKNQTQLCRDIYLISDFKQEIYEKFELKNEGSFIECVFLINFSKIIVKKKEDLFQFDQIIDFYTINI